ncbi:MAG: hypothetical protein O2911_09355 [Bacteroidetes bacterium]|nr:hypothetical protein [Bacteroidota bacterium]
MPEVPPEVPPEDPPEVPIVATVSEVPPEVPPEGPIVETVSDKNEFLKQRLDALASNNISHEIIEFVENAIKNETNKIIKQTIVDNLQRYAEICGDLKKTLHI